MKTMYILEGIAAFAFLVCLQFPLAQWLGKLKGWKQVNILGGMAQYIFWDKNEAVIITRGEEEEVIKGKGGERFIFLFLRGERLRARVPLADRLFTTEPVVDIFDLAPCKLKISVRWAVADASAFINKNDSGGGISEVQEITEQWLESLTEHISRVVSQESFQAGFLYMILLKESKRLALDEQINVTDDINPRLERISDKLGSTLRAKLNKKTLNYGVSVEDAAIRSITMNPKVQERLLAQLLERLKIDEAELEARARQIREEAQIETDRKRHAMRKEELGQDGARILAVMEYVLPKLEVDQKDFLQLITALEGHGSPPTITGREPNALRPPNDGEPEEEDDEPKD